MPGIANKIIFYYLYWQDEFTKLWNILFADHRFRFNFSFDCYCSSKCALTFVRFVSYPMWYLHSNRYIYNIHTHTHTHYYLKTADNRHAVPIHCLKILQWFNFARCCLILCAFRSSFSVSYTKCISIKFNLNHMRLLYNLLNASMVTISISIVKCIHCVLCTVSTVYIVWIEINWTYSFRISCVKT